MPKNMEQEQRQLYNELNRLAKRANQRLVRLEREFGKNTWAARRLRNRLEATPLQAFTPSRQSKC